MDSVRIISVAGLIIAGCAVSNGQDNRLNNLVVEHVRATIQPPADHDGSGPARSFEFQSQREGWVYLSLQSSGGPASASLDQPLVKKAILKADGDGGGPAEAMRLVGPGRHTVHVFLDAAAGPAELRVRSIPEIMWFPITFADWQMEASGRDWFYPKHEWDFIQRHLLPNGNALVFCHRPQPFEKYIRALHADGKLALMKENIPHYDSTPDQIYDVWGRPLEELAYVDGMTIDEFGGGEQHQRLYPTWSEVLDRIAQNPACKGKKIYAFTSSGGKPILPAIQRNNFRWLHEGYYMLGREEDRGEYASYIQRYGGTLFEPIRERFPGLIENNMLYTFGICDYQWAFDITPERDFNVFLDMQFHHIANHPSFAGMYGVCMYNLNQTTEQMARYAAALVRHYCIEGKKDRFNTNPLELEHLRNPSFEQGTADWQITPAGPDSVFAMDAAALPFKNEVSDRAIPNEKKVLCTVRSAQAPNVLSQRIANLKPGEYYSLQVMVCDLSDYGTTQLVPVSINLEGVEVVEDKSADRTWTNSFTNNEGPGQVSVCWNYRFRVFKARSSEALLRLSDWAGPDSPGPAGRKMIWDFIQLQPFYADNDMP